jgi:hypothetical protein
LLDGPGHRNNETGAGNKRTGTRDNETGAGRSNHEFAYKTMMSVFDFPTPGASPDQIVAEMQRAREYLQNAPDPNEVGADGRTLLLLALILCSTGEGEPLVLSLLERGSDPNQPTPWVNFTTLLSVSNSLPLVKKFIESGLRLNEIYGVSYAKGGVTDGPSTLLDHACGVRDYISPKRKKLNALANKYAGGLGKRRRFIDETIALLESHGAKRAVEVAMN